MFSVLDYGAINDGKTLCSEAFNKAINACRQAGGGTVYVPSGKYLTEPIQFVSNMTLWIESGAVVIFHSEHNMYPVVANRWEGADVETYAPLLYGNNLENITITGGGILDGQGEGWWSEFKSNSLKYPRPRFVAFMNCDRVLIEKVKFINSPSWTVTPVECSNVIIDKVTVINPPNSPNTDGIDPDSCRNVHITNCFIDVGDDCIAIKSGTEKCSKRIASENIIISNCTMLHGHGGVVIGSEMSGNVQNVVIDNCIFEGTDRGIRIKTRRGRGGAVQGLRVSNIIMKEVICPFVMNMYYFCGEGGKDKYVWDKKPYPIDERTPKFANMHFNNIEVENARAAAGFIYGLAEQFIDNISFTNVHISMKKGAAEEIPAMMSNLKPMAQQGFLCYNTSNIRFENVEIQNYEGEKIVTENAT